jgi:multidrug resistance efflux pump
MQTETGKLAALDAASNTACIGGRWYVFAPEQQLRHLRVGDPVEVTFSELGDRRKVVEIKLLTDAASPMLPAEERTR